MKAFNFLFLFSVLFFPSLLTAEEIKLGIIGLDTSHSLAFIDQLNNPNKGDKYNGFRIVGAYPYGSRTIKSSYERIPEYVEKAKAKGVKITESEDELIAMSDYVLLETNDGHLHLEQAVKVLKAGKVMFIDKPVAATLVDAIIIYELAKKYNVPIFSSSALRFNSGAVDVRSGKYGKVYGADCYSPCAIEPSHPDFSWYGIHGIETLYNAMGVGCEKVVRSSSEGMDVVTGTWADGRIGTFRGIRIGSSNYGGTAFCEKAITSAGKYEGYEMLLQNILEFFETKIAPVSPEETIEIFTFMEAGYESKRLGGKPVLMQDVYRKAKKEADKKMSKMGY